MSKMYNIYLYIYLFILICTREKVEPWSFFSNSPEKALPPPTTTTTTQSGELIISLLFFKVSEPSPTSVPTRQHLQNPTTDAVVTFTKRLVLNTCIRNEWELKDKAEL